MSSFKQGSLVLTNKATPVAPSDSADTSIVSRDGKLYKYYQGVETEIGAATSGSNEWYGPGTYPNFPMFSTQTASISADASINEIASVISLQDQLHIATLTGYLVGDSNVSSEIVDETAIGLQIKVKKDLGISSGLQNDGTQADGSNLSVIANGISGNAGFQLAAKGPSNPLGSSTLVISENTNYNGNTVDMVGFLRLATQNEASRNALIARTSDSSTNTLLWANGIVPTYDDKPIITSQNSEVFTTATYYPIGNVDCPSATIPADNPVSYATVVRNFNISPQSVSGDAFQTLVTEEQMSYQLYVKTPVGRSVEWYVNSDLIQTLNADTYYILNVNYDMFSATATETNGFYTVQANLSQVVIGQDPRLNRLVAVPSSSTAKGVQGQYAADSSNFYFCYTTNNWLTIPSSSSIASISGSLQTQINSKQDPITLVAGSGISISESPSDTFTISSSVSTSGYAPISVEQTANALKNLLVFDFSDTSFDDKSYFTANNGSISTSGGGIGFTSTANDSYIYTSADFVSRDKQYLKLVYKCDSTVSCQLYLDYGISGYELTNNFTLTATPDWTTLIVPLAHTRTVGTTVTNIRLDFESYPRPPVLLRSISINEMGTEYKTHKYASCYSTAAGQVIGASSPGTAIIFGTEVFKITTSSGIDDISVNTGTGVCTCNIPGAYMVRAMLMPNGTPTDYWSIPIYKNGALNTNGPPGRAAAQSANMNVAILQLNKGDTFQVGISNGNSTTLYTDANWNRLQIARVG